VKPPGEIGEKSYWRSRRLLVEIRHFTMVPTGSTFFLGAVRIRPKQMLSRSNFNMGAPRINFLGKGALRIKPQKTVLPGSKKITTKKKKKKKAPMKNKKKKKKKKKTSVILDVSWQQCDGIPPANNQ